MRFFTLNTHKQMQLSFYLLDRMSFDAKISTFQAMLQSRFEKDYKKSCDKMMGKIRSIKDDRNIFAHYLTNLREDAPIMGVSYFKLRNGIDYVEYDVKKVGEIFVRVNECIDWIEELTKQI